MILFSGEAAGVVKMAWSKGMVVFIPLVITLVDRGAVLWTMPTRSKIEKMAARAVVGNRITTGIGVLGLTVITVVAGSMLHLFDFSGSWPPFAAGALYYAIAAFDDWRVRGRRFAEKPRVLFRFDPIGIDYLHPL